MLLQPRNSMEPHCRWLKLNIDETEPLKYFICENWDCTRKNSVSLLSTFRNKRCKCGKLMNRIISLKDLTIEKKGFVKESANFFICDDLYVLPNVVGTIGLLQKHGINNMEALEEQTVHISKEEVVDLLKFALISNTPMTDFIIKKKQSLDNFNRGNQSQFKTGEIPSDEGRKMVVKLVVRKSNSKIMFAEGEEDFADFLFGFLTFPLGGVLHMLQGFSSLSCFDKLYRSMTELSSERYFSSHGLKEKLVNPQCAPQFKPTNHILPVTEACLPGYYCFSFFKETMKHGGANIYDGFLVTSPYTPCYSNVDVNVPVIYVDPKSSTKESSSSGGFAKGPTTYMVTDDLVVTPKSYTSVFSYLNRSKVSLSDVEERVISIGLKEGLGILKASLTSTSALTNGLNQFLKTVKEEN